MKRLAASIFVFSTTLSIPFPAVAEIDEPSAAERRAQVSTDWTHNYQVEGPTVGVTFGSGQSEGSPSPWLLGIEEEAPQHFCNQYDEACLDGVSSLSGNAFGTACTSYEVTPCIESVAIKTRGSDWTSGTLVRIKDNTSSQKSFEWWKDASKWGEWPNRTILEVAENQGWEEVPAFDWPASETGEMEFAFPETIDLGGLTNRLLVDLRFGFNLVGGQEPQTWRPYYHKLSLSTTPVISRPQADAFPGVEVIYAEQDGSVKQGGAGPWATGWLGDECDRRDIGHCGYELKLPDDTLLRISIQIPKIIGGWFDARLNGPEIELSEASPKRNRLVVTAGAVETQITTERLQVNHPDQLEAIKKVAWKEVLEDLERNDNTWRSTGTVWEPSSGLALYEKWAPYLNQEARGTIQNWYVGKMAFTPPANSCIPRESQVHGFINTNSMVYQSGIPEFNGSYFNYKVAGLHKNLGGDLALGVYDFFIRSEIARCLYGFSKAPVSATVSVVGENGQEKVATTTVREQDSWLKLSAYGFTFSKNEIKSRVFQSQIKTLSNFTSSTLSSKQKAEIRAVLAKSDGNTKFICTGIRYFQQPMSENIKVRARAKAACEYAKSINPNFSYWYQTKTTQARSYNGKVMVVSKG